MSISLLQYCTDLILLHNRRLHPYFCTDVCLRALILAEGDLPRACVIIGIHLLAETSIIFIASIIVFMIRTLYEHYLLSILTIK